MTVNFSPVIVASSSDSRLYPLTVDAHEDEDDDDDDDHDDETRKEDKISYMSS